MNKQTSFRAHKQISEGCKQTSELTRRRGALPYAKNADNDLSLSFLIVCVRRSLERAQKEVAVI